MKEGSQDDARRRRSFRTGWILAAVAALLFVLSVLVALWRG